MSENKTVWVLGAGFSRGLGGPLLGNLLSEASYDNISHVYPEAFKSFPAVPWIYRLYQFGCDLPKRDQAAIRWYRW
jgi:hypothetical protein